MQRARCPHNDEEQIMQTPVFNLKSLRTLGIILACGGLAVGCAGNSVSPKSQETTPIASTTDTETPVITSEAKPMADMPQDTSSKTATPESNDAQSTPADNAAVVAETAPANEATADIQQPTQTTFYFGFNKTELDDQDKAVLQEHARFLKANPSLVLEINGHTDHTGPHNYNEFLSKLRAESVAKVLIADGINRSQMVIKALADDKPLADNSEPGKNRRVELQYDEMDMLSTK